MSEIQGEVRVRSVRTARSNNLVETVVAFGGGIARVGLSVVTLPLTVLPADSRQHLRNAAKEALSAVASLPGDLAKVADSAIDEWVAKADSEAEAKTAPKDELTAG
ncbi:MAG: hypothetical protein HGA65_16170 [Oscillochloris sp.]|nr:hypothetical protein [Oscillochloris sp.]